MSADRLEVKANVFFLTFVSELGSSIPRLVGPLIQPILVWILRKLCNSENTRCCRCPFQWESFRSSFSCRWWKRKNWKFQQSYTLRKYTALNCCYKAYSYNNSFSISFVLDTFTLKTQIRRYKMGFYLLLVIKVGTKISGYPRLN